jgi:hypothetical protein
LFSSDRGNSCIQQRSLLGTTIAEADITLTSLSTGLDTRTMTSQPSTNPPVGTTCTGSSNTMPPAPGLARQDTSSSIGSALRPPSGNWAFNISGVCPSCHHHHRSLQVHVRISDDSTQVGDVYCKRCQRLWLAFGNVNATRLSLLSTISLDPDPIENDFRSTLIHMIRYSTPIAALSPTLTVIPEATSAGPSREASVRSTVGRGSQRPTTTFLDSTAQMVVDDTSGRYKQSKHPLIKGRQMLSSVKQKARMRFFKSNNIPFGLGRWFSKGESLEYGSNRKDPACAPISASPTTAISSSPANEHTESPEEVDTNFDLAAFDVCTSSVTATDALDALKALDLEALRTLPSHQQVSWARKQLSDFKSRYSGVMARMAMNGTMDSDGLTEQRGYLPWLDGLPARPHSTLAYIGGEFYSHEDSNVRRESDHTFNGRPISMSETQTSDSDTLVDDSSISSAPRHIFVETLHRDYRRSLSPRPLSIDSIVQDWSQVRRNRAEVRRSIDSTATGGAIRSITTARTHAYNRLSRNSMNRASSVYGTEPTTSRAQLRVDEGDQHAGAPQSPRSPSPSPLIPETGMTL